MTPAWFAHHHINFSFFFIVEMVLLSILQSTRRPHWKPLSELFCLHWIQTEIVLATHLRASVLKTVTKRNVCETQRLLHSTLERWRCVNLQAFFNCIRYVKMRWYLVYCLCYLNWCSRRTLLFPEFCSNVYYFSFFLFKYDENWFSFWIKALHHKKLSKLHC